MASILERAKVKRAMHEANIKFKSWNIQDDDRVMKSFKPKEYYSMLMRSKLKEHKVNKDDSKKVMRFVKSLDFTPY